jgi:hypothetical protein
MLLMDWVQSLKGSTSRRNRIRRPCVGIERLEDRTLLSGHGLLVEADVVTVNEGETAVNLGSITGAEGEDVTLTASIGTVTEVDGEFTWSFDTDDGPGESQEVTIFAEDADGDTVELSFELIVENVAPEVSISGPAEVVAGDTVEFTLNVSDPSIADMEAGFTFDIDWNGDGEIDETVTGMDGLVVSHTFETTGATTVVVTATDKDGGVSAEAEILVDVTAQVTVDPGKINLTGLARSQGRANGVITVIVRSTDDFDAATIDVSTATFAGANVSHSSLEDVNGNGRLDLVLHFRLKDTNLLETYSSNVQAGGSALQSIEAELSAETDDGGSFSAAANVDVMMKGKALRDLLDSI